MRLEKPSPPYMVWSRPLSNRGGFLKSFPSRYTFGRSLGTRCEGVCYIITNGDIVGDLSCGHTGPRVLVTGACLHRVTRLSAHIAVNTEDCKANSDYYRVYTCGEYLVVTTTNIRSRNMSSPWLVWHWSCQGVCCDCMGKPIVELWTTGTSISNKISSRRLGSVQTKYNVVFID